MKELIKKLQKYEIRIRKAVNSQMQGNFRSLFKSSGIEFDEVRPYQYGDDVRAIDWNVSAKGQGIFVRTFKEEKEQTILFLLDVSASQEIGEKGNQKIDIVKEICGVLSLSAMKEGSQVGVLCYSDQKELYRKPSKSRPHIYNIIGSIFGMKNNSLKTNLNNAVKTALHLLKRKSILIIISDFVDINYYTSLKIAAQKHDMVLIHINDKKENTFPKMGIVPLYEKESQKTIWINTSSHFFKNKIDSIYRTGKEELKKFCIKNQVDYLHISTEEDYVLQLVQLFKIRNKTKKTG
ncbi:MAG: DUF58 domain-containing protein [Chitinophagaceae bacterium]|nr:DUF58 domain-containing protein [Chitinophagaceae bacterium]